MGNWIIKWKFNKTSYAPGELAQVDFWLVNTDSNLLFVSELGMDFDFGFYKLEPVSGMIPIGEKFLGSVNLLLPITVVGIRKFRLKYRMYECINNNWFDHGFFTPDMQYFISIFPEPFYRVFVSRGLSIDDKAIGNPIVEIMRQWSLDPVTVGIERQVPDEQVPTAVKEEIRTAEAIIAIATPRHRDNLRGFWKTLEWLHDEIGIAFGFDKPLLILKDTSVDLGGLPSYLAMQKQIPLIEYSLNNLEELRIGLSFIMPGFREWMESKRRQDRELIENKRRQEYFDGLQKLAVGGLALIGGITVINGIFGGLSGKSKKR